MRAYMKSATPLLGVPAPQQGQACREVFAAHPLRSWEAWRDTVLALWRGAQFREERWAAIALTGERRYRAYQTLDTLPMYQEMIVTGAWWDLVDGIAIHRIGGLLRAQPAAMRVTMLAWCRVADR